MKLPRRKFLHLAVGAAALPAVSLVARAQAYPSRPITMIVPFPAGGANDVVARILAERMRLALGQRIVVENVGGADGSIGVGRTARAPPDGYTICLGIDGSFVLNGAFYSLPYDLLNDFAPISAVATGPIVLLARTTMPAKDLIELVAWLKAHPGQASAGMNTLGFHLLAARFQKETETQFTIVPYRAAGAVVQDLVAGRIDLAFATMTTHLSIVRAGSEKAGIDATEKVVVRKQLRRSQVLAFFKALPPCLIGPHQVLLPRWRSIVKETFRCVPILSAGVRPAAGQRPRVT
jgi:tripartite-type tricarboxylate transporter receptor subunit TctC